MCNLSTINNFKKKETTVAVGEVYDKASRGGGGAFLCFPTILVARPQYKST